MRQPLAAQPKGGPDPFVLKMDHHFDFRGLAGKMGRQREPVKRGFWYFGVASAPS